jgi:archaellum component FlaC
MYEYEELRLLFLDGEGGVVSQCKDDLTLLDELLAEVKELREWKAQVERICRTMYGPSRDTALFIMTNEVEEE